MKSASPSGECKVGTSGLFRFHRANDQEHERYVEVGCVGCVLLLSCVIRRLFMMYEYIKTVFAADCFFS